MNSGMTLILITLIAFAVTALLGFVMIPFLHKLKFGQTILDIGPATAAMYAQIIAEAGTVVWNGPVGAFEIDQFGKGTEAIAKAVAETSAYTATGGGDSIAALEKYGYASQVDYISTAGGAFLEVLEGKTLPAVAALEARAAS